MYKSDIYIYIYIIRFTKQRIVNVYAQKLNDLFNDS
jgi:hypothetical protein